MAYIKRRKTKKGITFHLVDIINGIEKAVKLPAWNMREATAYLHKYIGDKVDNKPNSLMMDQTLFKDFLQVYLEFSKVKKNELTYKRDLSALKPLLKEWGNLSLHRITHASIQEVQTKWINEGLSKKTVNNRCLLLSSILTMAFKQNLIVRKPEIPKFKIDKRPPRWYSDEEIKAILDNARPSVKDFVIVLLNTGMRRGELQRLQWSDIDLINKKIMIGVSKSHKFRVIPINTTLELHLKELFSRKQKDQVYLFEGKTIRKPFSVEYYTQAIEGTLKKLNISGNVHAFRHTFASRLVQKGVNIYDVSKLLGHASVQTTQIYAHLRNDDLYNAVNKL